jgi:predicted NAD/FAD-dependent oxidoreductase
LIGDTKTFEREFDAVILAIPPSQAEAILNQEVNLFPQLSEVEMLPCWAVMAVFESEPKVPFDAAVVKDASLAWVARNSSKPKRGDQECWVLHGDPKWSQDNLDADPEWIAEELVSTLIEISGSATLRPSFAKAHRWRFAQAADPLARGCFWDPVSRLGVCGDWCQESRVEGAYLSGTAIAEKIIGNPE